MLCQDSFVCKHLLHFRCSFPPCLFLPLFFSHFPPSSSPPVLHPLRSSVKLLTCPQDKELQVCIDCVRAMAAYARDSWGLRACWTSYFPPTSHPVAALKWGHLLSDSASAFPTHTRTSHYATSSSRVQTKWNASCIRQMDSL